MHISIFSKLYFVFNIAHIIIRPRAINTIDFRQSAVGTRHTLFHGSLFRFLSSHQGITIRYHNSTTDLGTAPLLNQPFSLLLHIEVDWDQHETRVRTETSANRQPPPSLPRNSIMAGGAKRMSKDEKRKAVLDIYHTTKQVYTEKEILSLASKEGVNANT